MISVWFGRQKASPLSKSDASRSPSFNRFKNSSKAIVSE
jgi:hypothetical protein